MTGNDIWYFHLTITKKIFQEIPHIHSLVLSHMRIQHWVTKYSFEGQITFPVWPWKWTLLLPIKTCDDFLLNSWIVIPSSPLSIWDVCWRICKTRGTKATSQRLTLESENNPQKEESKIQIVWNSWLSVHLVTSVTFSPIVAITKIPLPWIRSAFLFHNWQQEKCKLSFNIPPLMSGNLFSHGNTITFDIQRINLSCWILSSEMEFH